MSNLKKLELENAVLKLYVILNHTWDIFVPKIKLNPKSEHSLPWSNYKLRNLIEYKKIDSKSIKSGIYSE